MLEKNFGYKIFENFLRQNLNVSLLFLFISLVIIDKISLYMLKHEQMFKTF